MNSKHSACGHCGQNGTKRCANCQNIQYCSSECQQADWAFHKVLCKLFKDFAHRPEPNVRRALFFPEHGDKPHFIWVPVSPRHIGYPSVTEDFGVPEKDEEAEPCAPTSTGPLGDFTLDLLVCGKLRSGELLDHSVLLLASVNLEGHGQNQSLRSLAKVTRQDADPRFGRGPLMMIAMNKVKEPQSTVDLDATSFTLALDAIIGLAPPGQVAVHARKVPAVKVNYTAPPYLEQLDIPKRHPVFKSGTKCKLAELLATPLQTWFYRLGKESADDPGSGGVASANAHPFDTKILHLCVDPASPDFGRVPAAMQADKRSMLVARPTNARDLGLDLAWFLKVGRSFEDKFVPWLSAAQGGTPEERLSVVMSMRAVAGVALEAATVQKKMKALGLSDKDAETSASAAVGLGPSS